MSDVQRRATERLIHEEGIKQKNMERITARAIAGLLPEAKPETLEPDWLAHFFDRGRLISDEQMQELWGNLLAGQANDPGRFSRRTVDLLYTMDKVDATAFERLCRFRWLFERDEIVPLVLGLHAEIYRSADITFDALTHLNSIGLVTFDGLATIGLTFGKEHLVTFHWSDKILVALELPAKTSEDDPIGLDVGHVIFTRAGKELASLVESEPVDGFCQYVVSRWQDAGYKPSVHPATPVASNL